MAQAENPNTRSLDNHLGWQGWQLDLPDDWNPGLFAGSARSGTVIVADLERPRIELNWRRVRSARGVDLSRLARARGKENLIWKPLTPAGRGIAQLQHAVADNGDTLALALANASRRLLFVRLAGTPHGTEEPLTRRILTSLADATDEPTVPWCVYGFAWNVPRNLQLDHHRLAAGHATLTFRHRRRSLTFKRSLLTTTQPDQPKKSPPSEANIIRHNGHRIQPTRISHRKLWDRILGGQAWQAGWSCTTSKRQFHVEATGPEAANALVQAVQSVKCHQQTADQSPG